MELMPLSGLAVEADAAGALVSPRASGVATVAGALTVVTSAGIFFSAAGLGAWARAGHAMAPIKRKTEIVLLSLVARGSGGFITDYPLVTVIRRQDLKKSSVPFSVPRFRSAPG